jgi:hypothetical protein
MIYPNLLCVLRRTILLWEFSGLDVPDERICLNAMMNTSRVMSDKSQK